MKVVYKATVRTKFQGTQPFELTETYEFKEYLNPPQAWTKIHADLTQRFGNLGFEIISLEVLTPPRTPE